MIDCHMILIVVLVEHLLVVLCIDACAVVIVELISQRSNAEYIHRQLGKYKRSLMLIM